MQPARPDAAALAEWRKLALEGREAYERAGFGIAMAPNDLLALLSAYEAERARAERLAKALDVYAHEDGCPRYYGNVEPCDCALWKEHGDDLAAALALEGAGHG